MTKTNKKTQKKKTHKTTEPNLTQMFGFMGYLTVSLFLAGIVVAPIGIAVAPLGVPANEPMPYEGLIAVIALLVFLITFFFFLKLKMRTRRPPVIAGLIGLVFVVDNVLFQNSSLLLGVSFALCPLIYYLAETY
jgi:hypothetical protein